MGSSNNVLKVAVLGGDGTGPEVTAEGVKAGRAYDIDVILRPDGGQPDILHARGISVP